MEFPGVTIRGLGIKICKSNKTLEAHEALLGVIYMRGVWVERTNHEKPRYKGIDDTSTHLLLR